VVRGGLPLELVGWQLCRGAAVLNEEDIRRIQELATPLAHFAIECNSAAQAAYLEQTGERGISLPDPVAMSIALDPTVCTDASSHYLDVETTSTLTRGMTVVDRLGVAKDSRNGLIWKDLVERPANAKVCWSLDIEKWKKSLFAALSSC
jgi:purine nucleosidase